jgi:hypothetical protein
MGDWGRCTVDGGYWWWTKVQVTGQDDGNEEVSEAMSLAFTRLMSWTRVRLGTVDQPEGTTPR